MSEVVKYVLHSWPCICETKRGAVIENPGVVTTLINVGILEEVQRLLTRDLNARHSCLSSPAPTVSKASRSNESC